jgi:hypothetical protein
MHIYSEINERLNHEENIDYLYCLVLKCVLFLLFNVAKKAKMGVVLRRKIEYYLTITITILASR